MSSIIKKRDIKNNFLADYCWTVSGSQRRKIIIALMSEKLPIQIIPSQIQRETGISFCNVSRALRALVERDLVECLYFEKRHRLYRLTEKGSMVANKIKIL